jgi:hypothetical protein
VKNVQPLFSRRSINHNLRRSLALGAVILAASAGSAMAQSAATPRPVKTASAAGEATIKHGVIETRPAPVDKQPVVPHNAPAARPVVARVPPGHQPAQAAADGVDLAHLKASFGWVDLPAIVIVEDNAALAERAKSTLGWIDVPTDIAGFQSDEDAASAFRNAVPQ